MAKPSARCQAQAMLQLGAGMWGDRVVSVDMEQKLRKAHISL